MLGQYRIIPALRLKHRSGGSPRQEPPQAAVALRSASLRLGVRHGICVAKMLDNVGLRYPHRASGAKAPRTLRPLPLLRFAVSATGGAHLCSIQYYLRFWLSSCRTSLAVSALRIMRYCPYKKALSLIFALQIRESAFVLLTMRLLSQRIRSTPNSEKIIRKPSLFQHYALIGAQRVGGVVIVTQQFLGIGPAYGQRLGNFPLPQVAENQQLRLAVVPAIG